MDNIEVKEANQSESLFVVKRNGEKVPFEKEKIKQAVLKANNEEKRGDLALSDEDIEIIVEIIYTIVSNNTRVMSVEEIQDIVEREICKRSYEVFLLYHNYRYKRQKKRDLSDIDAKIKNIIDVSIQEDGTAACANEEVREENSNKNPTILSVQRDYIAGEWCRHYSNEYMLSDDIRKANEEGIIHFHDMDFYPMQMSNCCLVNLEDMLQNGTCISGTMIEKPKSFTTACTVSSQIAASVASSQYGGQTMTLSHLAPFVEVSRQKIRERLKAEWQDAGINFSEEQLFAVAEKEVETEVASGCQTIQYQLVTLHSTNGQAPFITLFMYLDEVEDGQLRKDLALIIKTMLEQRIYGIKDRAGALITPAFPKLIYVLEEDNIKADSEYFWLTRLAAKCTAKRMVPDYISEKKMKKLKGDVYPCMGCVQGAEKIVYRHVGETFYRVNTIEDAWKIFSKIYKPLRQTGRQDDFYIDLDGIEIYDNKVGWTKCRRIIRNNRSHLIQLKFNDGRKLICTPDHPLDTENRGVVRADELSTDDKILATVLIDDYENIESQGSKNIQLVKRRKYKKDMPSYDVTTESEHFMVSGIYSHNCRSFLTPDRFTDNSKGNIANAKNYKEGKHKYYGRLIMPKRAS